MKNLFHYIQNLMNCMFKMINKDDVVNRDKVWLFSVAFLIHTYLVIDHLDYTSP